MTTVKYNDQSSPPSPGTPPPIQDNDGASPLSPLLISTVQYTDDATPPDFTRWWSDAIIHKGPSRPQHKDLTWFIKTILRMRTTRDLEKQFVANSPYYLGHYDHVLNNPHSYDTICSRLCAQNMYVQGPLLINGIPHPLPVIKWSVHTNAQLDIRFSQYTFKSEFDRHVSTISSDHPAAVGFTFFCQFLKRLTGLGYVVPILTGFDAHPRGHSTCMCVGPSGVYYMDPMGQSTPESDIYRDALSPYFSSFTDVSHIWGFQTKDTLPFQPTLKGYLHYRYTCMIWSCFFYEIILRFQILTNPDLAQIQKHPSIFVFHYQIRLKKLMAKKDPEILPE